MTVLCEVEKSRVERLRFSLGSVGGYRVVEVQLVQERPAQSGTFISNGRPLRIRIEKMPEFIAALVTAVREAGVRGWIAPKVLSRCGLELRR